MWKEPDYLHLDAPQEIVDTIRSSIFWNSEGYLRGAPFISKFQYFLVFTSILFFPCLIIFIIFELMITNTIVNIIGQILIYIVIVSVYFYFIKWGFYDYKEAWYNFDEKEEILIIIRKKSNRWETIELPYEEIDEINWSGDSQNGFAIIKSLNMKFYTNRSLDKRKSSVTEIWSKLARIDTDMKNWPIYLTCDTCKRVFGHHIGTAQCPFDDILLIDKNVKGRIDPEEIHPEDLDRL